MTKDDDLIGIIGLGPDPHIGTELARAVGQRLTAQEMTHMLGGDFYDSSGKIVPPDGGAFTEEELKEREKKIFYEPEPQCSHEGERTLCVQCENSHDVYKRGSNGEPICRKCCGADREYYEKEVEGHYDIPHFKKDRNKMEHLTPKKKKRKKNKRKRR